jgi:hypothetical protein
LAWLAAVAVGAAALGCGAEATPDDLARGGAGHTGGAPPRAEREAGAPSTPSPSGATGAAAATFADPGCPKAPEPEDEFTCDPLSDEEACEPGYACSPFVRYPSAPCEPEVFGTYCRLHGSAVQGESCLYEDCAPGYLCVASGLGTSCAELCALPGADTCPPGLLCGSVDLKGFGVCF